MHSGERWVYPVYKLNSKALAASLLIHLAAFPCLLLSAIPARRPAVRQEAVDVEIVRLPRAMPERAQDLRLATETSDTKPVAPSESSNDISSRAVQHQPVDEGPLRVKPRHMLSEMVLSDDRSRETRKVLSQLAPAEQVEQLCNLEAMAQVGAWNRSLRPDRVVAYATTNTRFDGASFSAEGAALHSRDDWYRLQFKCDLTPDGRKVVAFEFLLGETIPKRDWQDFSLPDESGLTD